MEELKTDMLLEARIRLASSSVDNNKNRIFTEVEYCFTIGFPTCWYTAQPGYEKVKKKKKSSLQARSDCAKTQIMALS